MNENLQNEINLHSAGATIRHQSAFDHLKSHQNDFQLDQEFIDKWVLPFYMKIWNTSGLWITDIKNIQTAKFIEQHEGEAKAKEFLASVSNLKFNYNLDTEWITAPLQLLKELREYCK
ncbi:MULTISPECIES: hypothetical protein [unclassified Chryseobacterium]|uniref:hypothetical protein n=1 Tax=unclassified Chryseobacterium TaxID=2593645 RepID=UPI0030104F36